MSYIEMDNFIFKKYKGEKYYYCSKIKKRLHRYVWEKNNGCIPKGYHIHHIDGNVDNNSIGNLELISAGEHLSSHSKKRCKKELLNILFEKAIPKSKEWHGSKEGIEWHKKHFEKNREKILVEKKYICKHCGVEYKSTQKNTLFCSRKCNSAYKRKENVYTKVCKCEVCDKEFTTNKYRSAKTCSRKCASILSYKSRGGI